MWRKLVLHLQGRGTVCSSHIFQKRTCTCLSFQGQAGCASLHLTLRNSPRPATPSMTPSSQTAVKRSDHAPHPLTRLCNAKHAAFSHPKPSALSAPYCSPACAPYSGRGGHARVGTCLVVEPRHGCEWVHAVRTCCAHLCIPSGSGLRWWHFAAPVLYCSISGTGGETHRAWCAMRLEAGAGGQAWRRPLVRLPPCACCPRRCLA